MFLEGVKAALTADAAFKAAGTTMPPTKGLRAAGRVYAGWGFSQAFYWDQVYKRMGHSRRLGLDLAFSSLEDFVVWFWGATSSTRGAMPTTCSRCCGPGGTATSANASFNGDLRPLRSITARADRAYQAEKDLYFPPEDEEWAGQHIPNGEVRVIPGVWGHFAGSGDSPVDLQYIDDVLKELLAT